MCVCPIMRYRPRSLGFAVGGPVPRLSFWLRNSPLLCELLGSQLGKDNYRYCELEPCQRFSPWKLWE